MFLLNNMMRRGASFLKKTLELSDVELETKCGHGSLCYVKCDCGCLNTVPSGKRHLDPNCPGQRRKTFDVNTKAVGGMSVVIQYYYMHRTCVMSMVNQKSHQNL